MFVEVIDSIVLSERAMSPINPLRGGEKKPAPLKAHPYFIIV